MLPWQVPAYKMIGYGAHWSYDLQPVSVFKEEAEILMLPYTMFEVIDEPTEVEGVTEIHIKVSKQPLVYQLDVLFVWVDPNGFAGANRNLAQYVFDTNMPSFRRLETPKEIKKSWGTTYDYNRIRSCGQCVALFEDVDAALQWIGETIGTKGANLFRLASSGRASEQFFNGYFKKYSSTPCEARRRRRIPACARA